MALHRYRVRAGHKTWNDKGPDLLRPLQNAVSAARTILRKFDQEDGLELIVDGEDAVPTNRLKALRRIRQGDYDTVKVVAGGVVRVAVKHERIEKMPLAHCSTATSVLWSLVHHQFPNVVFAGGFVDKQTFPGFTSDHAYSTAFDGTPRGKGVDNDGLTDWLVRMALARCTDFDYVIGSRNGRVVSASAPDFDVEAGGGDDSHEWHNHVSIVDHDGAAPPRSPMY